MVKLLVFNAILSVFFTLYPQPTSFLGAFSDEAVFISRDINIFCIFFFPSLFISKVCQLTSLSTATNLWEQSITHNTRRQDTLVNWAYLSQRG